MRQKTASESGLYTLRVVIAVLLCTMSGWMAVQSFAGNPSSGTLSPSNPYLTYTAGPFTSANATPVLFVHTGPVCNSTICDSYALTVDLPAGYTTTNPGASIRVSLSWTDTGSGNSDYDLYVYKGEVGDTNGNRTSEYSGDGQTNPEVASIYPLQDGQSKFTIKVVPFTPTAETVQVRIELLTGVEDPNAFPNFGGPDAPEPGKPRYQTYYPPSGTSAEPSSGEFNIGFNPATGRIMANNAGPVWRLTPAEALGKPECCEALWEDKSSTIADEGVDPILWTDEKSGRTFASNFTGGANAAYAYTDNDGDVWTVLGAAVPNGGADHQTIATGPYPESLSMLTTPVNKGQATYYCSQAVVGPAFCQRSDDLGTSYGPGTLAYDGSPGCRGLHGHMRVAPDGTVYVPVPDCNVGETNQNGVAVSTDGGITWTERYIPNSEGNSRGSDPGIAIDKDNRVYFFYILETDNGNQGHMYVQTSTDRGVTWSNPRNLGASHGIKNVAFPHGVAGDPGRAAVGFVATNEAGNLQSIAFPGIWYSFVSTTYDGGETWVTTNVSPNDPVQGVGGIWHGGGSNQNRNLLDFNEITMDDKGRVLYGFSDGCVGNCVADPSSNPFVAHMRVARQTGGKTLLASQDAVVDTTTAIAPKAACLSGTRDPVASRLKWITPDNGGAAIQRYQIFRGTAPGAGVLLGETPTAKPAFDDYTADPNVERYYYTIKAINDAGVGIASNEIELVVTPLPAPRSRCALPGLTVLGDTSGDNLNQIGSTDIREVSMAELYDPALTRNKLTIRLKMADLSTLPPETRWVVRFTRTENGVPTNWFISMTTEAPDASVTAPKFKYGHVEVGAGGTQSNVNDGNIDGGSYLADGTILFTVSQPTKTGTGATNREFPAFQTGEVLSNVNVVVFQKVGVSLQQMDTAASSAYTIAGNASCAAQMLGAFSRKQHGLAGAFDVPLPADGSGVEPRRGSGTNSDVHQVVFRFNIPLSSVGSSDASASGQPLQSSGEINPGDPHEYVVSISGATSPSTVTVNLGNVSDIAGNNTSTLSTSFGLLLGDANGDRAVNSGDAMITRNYSGSTVDPANFRTDVNLDGVINSGDAFIVRRQSGSGL